MTGYPGSLPVGLFHVTAPNGVTTGFISIPVRQLRSFEDRLGKAARKHDNGDIAAAWIAVGRVQAELRSLLPSEVLGNTAPSFSDATESAGGTPGEGAE